MSKRVQLIRQNTIDSASQTLLEGELSINLDSDSLIVHDGAKSGGFPVARFDLINSPVASAANDGKMSKEQVQELNTASGVVQSLDKQIGGYLTKSISGSVGLTDAEADNLFIEFTGTLAADAIIQFPNNAQIHYVSNRTTGGFNVVCEIVGGSRQISVIPGQTEYFIADNSSPTKEFAPILAAYAGRNLRRGLDITPGSTSFDVADGTIIDDTGSFLIRLFSTPTVDLTTIGANGLDQGVLASDTGYFVFAIGDSSGVNPGAFVVSLSQTSPVIPGGYDKKSFLGYISTNGAATLISFSNTGCRYRFAANIEIFNQVSPTLSGVAVMPVAVPGGLIESYTLIAFMELEASNSTTNIYQLKLNDAILGVPSVVGTPDLQVREAIQEIYSGQSVIEMSGGDATNNVYWLLSQAIPRITMRFVVSGFVLKANLDLNLP